MPISVTTNTRIAPGAVQEVAADPLLGGVVMEIETYTPPQFRNAGLISVTGLTGFGGYDRGFTDPDYTAPIFWNEAGGVFQVYMTNPREFLKMTGVSVASNTFVNEGVVDLWSASQDGLAVGVDFRGTFGRYFANSGVISTAAVSTVGVDVHGSSHFTNTGRIEAFGQDVAEGVRYEGLSYRDSFTNAGTIIAQVGEGSPYASIGIHSFNPSPGTYTNVNTFFNSGLVVGDYAFRAAEMKEGLYSVNAPSIEVLTNTGEMRGVVFMAEGDDVVRNRGLIDGYVDLFTGDDLYDGSGGAEGAVVFGGEGRDRLVGGSGADILFGDQGADTILGGDGDDYIDGGRGADALDGGRGVDILSFSESSAPVVVNLAAGVADSDARDRIQGFEIVLGSRLSDTLTGSDGDDTLLGLAGGDIVSGGGGDDIIYGGRGDDTLSGGAGSDIFVFERGDGHDTIVDFKPGLLNDLVVVNGYAGYQSLTQQGADVLITLSATDDIVLRNRDVSTLSNGDIVFQTAAATPPVPDEPVLQPIYVQGDYLVVPGEVLEFINPKADLSYTPVRYAPGVIFQLGLNATFVNGGTIRLDAAPPEGSVAAIDAQDSAQVSAPKIYNQTGGLVEAHAANNALAIGIQGRADLWNAGRIEVSSSGNAQGVSIANGLAVNSGVTTVTAGVSATGLVLHSNDIHNSGLVEARGDFVSYGLSIQAGAGVTVNSGTIRVSDSTAALDSAGIYYSYTGASVIFNSGVIEADYALREGPNLLPVPPLAVTYNTGELRGLVDLGGGSGRLYNFGLVTGHIDLGSEDDLYDGRTGTETGGVSGGSGADTLLGGAGVDVLDGGEGGDILGGGAGADVLTGGGGDDRFRFESGGGADVITDFVAGGVEDAIVVVGYSAFQSVQQLGADTLVTFSGADSILLKNVTASGLTADDFQFSAAALAPVILPLAPDAPANPEVPSSAPAPEFVIVGGQGLNLEGGAGNDTILGVQSGETLTGLQGDDLLSGGAGDDILVGGQGEDRLEGGAGADIFVYAAGDGLDHFLDFNPSEGDVLRLVGYTTYSFSSFSRMDFSDGGHIDFGDALSQAELSAAIEFVAGPPPQTPPPPAPGPSMQLTATVQGNGTLIGTAQNELIRGGSGNDRLYGEGGYDRLEGGGGADLFVVRHGGGHDTLFDFNPGAGDVLYLEGYGPGDFTISTVPVVGTVISLVDGGSVTTSVSIASLLSIPGAVQFGATAPEALLTVSGPAAVAAAYSSTSVGTEGADTLTGTAESDHILGLGGADTLDGGAGDDVLEGGEGDDLLIAGPGDDVYDGGAGYDTISFASSARAVTVSLLPSGAFDFGHPFGLLMGLEAAIGSDFDDQITGQASGVTGTTLDGGAGNDILTGTDWSDVLTGGDGNDHLVGGDRADILSGGAGDDILDGGGSETDTLTGGSGSDTFVIRWFGGSLITDFNPAEDKLQLLNWTSYVSATASGSDTVITLDDRGQTIVLQHVTPGQLSASNFIYYQPQTFDQIHVGDTASDTLIGTALDDSLLGFGGDDVLVGGAGDDDVRGGLGEDVLYGQAGNDRLRDGGETTNRDYLYGGAGNDTYYVTSSLTGPTDLVFEGGSNPDLMAGPGDIDVIYSQGSFFWDYYGVGEILYIDSPAGSQLVGGTNNQSFFGNIGTDIILAYGGSNRIDAGAGTDVIGFGLYGLDESYDGVNTVVMKAGSGIDYVYDFESGVDKIDLTAFHFGITGQQVLDQAVNVDLAGTADDHVYFYLTGAGGVDNYIVFMGMQANQLHASDFVTGTP